MELTRYSVIEGKNPREIVLLRGRGCAWRRCKFCDYHLDASRDEQANLALNRKALSQVMGVFGRLEAINSGSFAELDESTVREIERVCREKGVRDLHIESHWLFRRTLPALRARFSAQGVRLHVKIGVETFDADYRERVLEATWRRNENDLTRAGHMAICQALRDRDEDAAAAAVYEHLALTGAYRESLIEQNEEDEKKRRAQEAKL